MRRQYKVRGDKVGTFAGVSLEGSLSDVTLAGELGEIWEYSPGIYKGYKRTRKGEESLFTATGPTELRKWRERLRVPFRAEEQLKWANRK